MQTEESTPAAASSPPAVPYSTDRRPFLVPPRPSAEDLAGRDTELEAIREQLAAGRPVAIVGPDGAGKSSLAAEYAWRHGAEYPEGVVWLAADRDLAAQLSRLAVEAQWVAPESEHRVKVEVALHRLRSRSSFLLVFENLGDPALLAPYLPLAGATPHFLATGQEELPGFGTVRLAAPAAGTPELDLSPLDAEPELADLLAWSVPATLGLPFLAALLDRPEADLLPILDRWTGAGLVQKTAGSRFALPGPVSRGRRAARPWADRRDWAAGVATRLGDWFEARRQNAVDLPAFEAEVDALHAWQRHAEDGKSREAGRLLWLLAYPSHHRGQSVEAHDRVTRAFELFRQREERDPRLEAWLWNDLGVSSLDLGEIDEAEEAHQQALSLRLRELGAESADTATSLHHLATVHASRKEWEDALSLEERALEIQRQALGEDNAEIATALTALANVHGALEAWESALEFQAEALEIQSHVFGEEHPETAKAQNNLAGIYGELGNWQRALEIQQRALTIFHGTLGDEHPLTARLLNNIANSFANLGNWREALKVQSQAYAIVKKTLGDQHPDTVGAVLDTSVSLISLNRTLEARRLIEPYLRHPPAQSELRDQLKMIEAELRKRLPGFRQPSSKPGGKRKKKR